MNVPAATASFLIASFSGDRENVAGTMEPSSNRHSTSFTLTTRAPCGREKPSPPPADWDGRAALLADPGPRRAVPLFVFAGCRSARGSFFPSGFLPCRTG